ncbi:MAG: protoglobin domain-containing protein [Anaerolineae bacterium]
MDDRKSWEIKDEAILGDLASLMGLTAAEKAAMAAIKDQAQAAAPQLVEAFYSRLLAHAPTAEYLEGKVEHLRIKLQEWFAQIFTGNYDQAYVKSRMLIGQIHVRIGLPVRYPLAMMDLMIQHGEQIARQSAQPDQTLSAFRKLLALDIAIFNQAYEDTQLKHLAELVGNERLARRLLTQ